jgi:protein-S-isoprenylcysteine O-methyltransferase Ste14
MKYFILAILWISYCALHSAMITPKFTGFLQKHLGGFYKYYRLFYNSVALVLLVPVVLYTHSLSQTPFFSWDGYLYPVQLLMQAIGLFFLYAGARQYDMSTFLGLRQINQSRSYKLINASGKLNASGIFGVVRHPFYAAIFPLIWSANLDVTFLIVNCILSIYVIIGTILEERKLVSEFGDEYRNYQGRVSMLFPMKWIREKLYPRKEY